MKPSYNPKLILCTVLSILYIDNSTEIKNLNNKSIRLATVNYLANDGDSKYGPIESWDTSRVTDMSGLFQSYEGKYDNFKADLSQWDVSQVTNMDGMFRYAKSFNGNISTWDVSNVRNMRFMFTSAKSFNGDISLWDVSHVKNMHHIFRYAIEFNGDLSHWNVSNVTVMYAMFDHATVFNGDISQWNVSNVKNMRHMFRYAINFNRNIIKWDVSNVRNMDDMFNHARSFNRNLSQWDISNVTDMDYMFNSLESFDHTLCWDLSKVVYKKGMFTNSKGSVVKDSHDCNKYKMSTTKPILIDRCQTFPSYINKPIQVISGISSDKKKYCLYPSNNSIVEGTKLAISQCQDWKSFQWIVDYDSKIKNFHDPSFCIHMKGKGMILSKCVHGIYNQQWHYNWDQRLISNNGRKRAVVQGGITSDKAIVRRLLQKKDIPHKNEIWIFHFVSNSSYMSTINTYSVFRIVSGLTNNNTSWCMFPSENYFAHGIQLVLSKCKYWDSFKWTIDHEGKIMNFKNPTKCLTRSGKKLKLSDCLHDNIYQKWTYDVMSQYLSSLVNGEVKIRAERKEVSSQKEVRILVSKIEKNVSSCLISWYLEKL